MRSLAAQVGAVATEAPLEAWVLMSCDHSQPSQPPVARRIQCITRMGLIVPLWVADDMISGCSPEVACKGYGFGYETGLGAWMKGQLGFSIRLGGALMQAQ